MWIEDVDPRDRGWTPLGNRAWRLPNGSYFTFPEDRPEKLAREVDQNSLTELATEAA